MTDSMSFPKTVPQVSAGPREKQVAYYMGELGREIERASESLGMLRENMHMVLSQHGATGEMKSDGNLMPSPSTPLAAELNIFLQHVLRINAEIADIRDRLEA